MLRNDKKSITTFMLPASILLLLFMVLPFLMAFGLSFTNQRLIENPRGTQFVGMANYMRLLGDNLFKKGLTNNAIFVLVVVPLQTTLALVLAILVNIKVKGDKIFRAIFFIPTVTTMVVVSVIWSFLYHPDGLINGFLSTITFGTWDGIDFLNNTTTAFPSIMLMSIWQGVGFQMLIFLAALQEIPASFYEAADIDGANTWQQFLYITLPQLKNTTTFVIISTTILAFRLFTQVYVMTGGGPQNSTYTAMLHIYNTAFKRLNIGYSSALTVVFFLIILVISIFQRFVLNDTEEEV
ncbi:MAG: carbohydrate ABC transporter permease [Halanaerobium sp.]